MASEAEETQSDEGAGKEPTTEVRLGSRASHALIHDHELRQRLLRIRITDVETGRLIVGLRLPGGLLGVAERLGARLAPPGTGMADLISVLEGTPPVAPLVVEDVENGERIEITVEG